MCLDPVSLIGMALSGAGSFVNSQEASANQERMAKAREDAQKKEMERQRAFRDQSQTAFGDTRAGFGQDSQDRKLTDATTARTSTLQSAVSDVPNEYTSVPSSTPQIVKTDANSRYQAAFDKAKKMAGALGRLGARDDVSLGNRFALAMGGSRLADVGTMAAGSAGVSPLEINAAGNNAYESPSIWGDLLGVAGMGAGLAGMTGSVMGPSPGPVASAMGATAQPFNWQDLFAQAYRHPRAWAV